MRIKLSEIKNTEPRREHGAIKELAESIKKEGLLQPIVINQHNELICGRRRLDAVKLLNLSEIEVHQIETKDDIDKLSKAIAENIMRKNLSWQEEVKAKEELDQLMRAKYGESEYGGDRKSTNYQVSKNETWTQEKTAELLNQSTGIVSEDIQLAKELKENPELAKCKNKTRAKRLLKRKVLVEAPPLPVGKYNIIYADPPWSYQDQGCQGTMGNHYKGMKLEDICNLPIDKITDKDCILFIWVTYPMLKEGLQVIDSWGFEYKSIAFQWIKLNKRGQHNLYKHNYFYGLGRWTRGNTEPCLLATRGKPKRISNSVFQIVESPLQKHSKKPNEVRNRIVKLMGSLPRIELFAREKTEGWDVWGDEIESDITL